MSSDNGISTETSSARIGYLHSGKLLGTNINGGDLVRLVNEEFKGTILEVPIDEPKETDAPYLILMRNAFYGFALDTVLAKEGIKDIKVASPGEVMELMHSFISGNRELNGFQYAEFSTGVVLHERKGPNKEYARHLLSQLKQSSYNDLVQQGMPFILARLVLSKDESFPNSLKLDVEEHTIIEPAPSLKSGNWYGVENNTELSHAVNGADKIDPRGPGRIDFRYSSNGLRPLHVFYGNNFSSVGYDLTRSVDLGKGYLLVSKTK
ncbi:hypothetical protein HN695_03280 [Candidatus Woesearchaeota archaeon]|jgi:hypothetical protein|nr:hypothetical protein [Candidatus Woesearchaeota archaeon]MBT5272007.1 hypothetical protein [Candidatus Woesearchaeota archaeon]MBT6040748.1 hypothetical protein [Candidatus Woesearchaeota archaeon]MBT6336700.1 hypothetical protein [Candidatus Woesearchaeota archaeon]MBT7927333.1 hypothetical protein [Candidatus Woesearchaeota archaeon]